MENIIYHYTLFGQVRDSESYGGNTYSSAEYGDTSLTQNEAGLANTGQDIIAPLLIGGAMVVGSVIALVKMQRRKLTESKTDTAAEATPDNKTAPEVETTARDEDFRA